MSTLNEKQKKFCREYLKDFNGKKAAIRAGYTPGNATEQASRMLTYDNVKQELRRLSSKIEEKAIVDKEYVIKGLIDVHQRSLNVPVTTMTGQETGLTKTDFAGANRSLELLGKHLGMFQDKSPITVNFNELKQYFDVQEIK